MRRRTRCVYCGTRIPGAVPRGNTSTRSQRFAARFACERHYGLVAVDPAFGVLSENERMEAAG